MTRQRECLLNWIGKEAVVKHHKEVPVQLLEPLSDRSCGPDDVYQSRRLDSKKEFESAYWLDIKAQKGRIQFRVRDLVGREGSSFFLQKADGTLPPRLPVSIAWRRRPAAKPDPGRRIQGRRPLD